MSTMYLKLQNKTIMEFDVDEFFRVYDNNLMPFIIRDNIIDTSNCDNNSKEYNKIIRNNVAAFSKFLSYRKLNINRENAKKIFNQLHIPQKDEFDVNLKTMILCKAMSVVDDYWITDNKNEKWEDVNVRDNPLHEVLAQLALFGSSPKMLTITGKICTPELTGQGTYAKAWFRENGVLYLYKAGTKFGNEPQKKLLQVIF